MNRVEEYFRFELIHFNAWKPLQTRMSSSPESRAPRAPPASSLRNFSFALGAQLAGSDVPRVRADFEAWHARGVRAILNVHTHAHAQLYNAGADTFVEEITPLGFRCLHVPVEDLTAPTQAQIADSVAFIRACIGALEISNLWNAQTRWLCRKCTPLLYLTSQ